MANREEETRETARRDDAMRENGAEGVGAGIARSLGLSGSGGHGRGLNGFGRIDGRRGRRRVARRLLQDLLIVEGSLVLAYALSGAFSPSLAAPFRLGLFLLTAALPIALVYSVLFIVRRHYAVLPRYLAITDFVELFRSCGLLAAVSLLGEAFWPKGAASAPVLLVPVLFGFLVASALCGYRWYQCSLAWRSKDPRGPRDRALVVGAGDAGEAVVRELSRPTHGGHVIVGFVDDSPEKGHLVIHGRPVLGTIAALPELVREHSIDEVLIAMPSAEGETIRRVYDLCAASGARVRTLPSVAAVAANAGGLSRQFREIQIEDLLRRAPIYTDIREVAGYLSGEHVMITGGGGSIGSELARQVARLAPASLILVGKGENSIYEIEQELIQTAGFTPITVIADVRDALAMERVYADYRPSVVFHAAAHKHVPLMQKNPYEAIRNNVLGTLNVAELAVRHGVKRFILISTDKAVKPSSVMGATKRVCEKIVASLARSSDTEFAAVRFGNVLGSRGSLIPMLKAQMERGGPLRITHKEMTRFFMTIPEAVQLVVQAGAIGSRGEVFVLDMGDPVRIDDLAHDLVRMHGLRPGVDMGIQYTGMRPGEKLHEELLYDAEDLVPTTHPKIRMVGNARAGEFGRLKADVRRLVELAEAGDPERTRGALMEMAWDKNAIPLM